MSCQPKIIRIAAQFFVAVIRNKEIVFQPQATAARPINSWFDGQHHPFLDRAFAGLMRVGELMGARSHAVTDGVRRLAGISALGNAGANQTIEVWKVGAIARISDCLVENSSATDPAACDIRA